MPDLDANLDFRRMMIERRFKKIDRTIAVVSGKGGVGKSIVAATMSALMAKDGMSIGLLDADLYGPSSTPIFGIQGPPKEGKHGLLPPISNGVKVMSIDLFVAGRPIPLGGNAAREIIKEILALTDFGDLDYLIVDMPPGTGEIILGLLEAVEGKISAIAVTTPTKLSASVVLRIIELLLAAQIPIIGILENMSYVLDSGVGPRGQSIGKTLSAKYGVRFLGELPFDPKVAEAADLGDPRSLLETDFSNCLSTSLRKADLL